MTQEAILVNTGTFFYVQKYNNEGNLLDGFEEYSIRDQNEFTSFLKRVEAKGLESIDASDKILLNFIYFYKSPMNLLVAKFSILGNTEKVLPKRLGKSYVEVVCGTKFPEELGGLSKTKGFIVVFPGGGRYKVKEKEFLQSCMREYLIQS
ncbi:hypothetical protein C1646_676140 [Rhizophagus diaphanus]|nr:hypothetical protein C1646_676140 [Rhizophagus diaphanus] [Rhizophagus sp. MUCL 43196]